MSIENNSFLEDLDEESKIQKNSENFQNVEDFFDVIFSENMNLKCSEEDFKSILSKNYQQVLEVSEERGKFLEIFDLAKEKLAQSHKKILQILDKKAFDGLENEKDNESEKESSEEKSDQDELEEKIDDYIERKKNIKGENDFNENEKQSCLNLQFKIFFFRRNSRSSS